MPVQAPVFESPTVPYHCPDLKTITAYCRTTPELIKKYLEQTPFEYISDHFILTIADFGNASNGNFYDVGVIVPVKYKDVIGGYYLFEYENTTWSCIAGRELWGYPKKFADASLEEKDGKVTAAVTKDGVELMRLEMDLNNSLEEALPETPIYPHLLLYTMPRPDGPGILTQMVLSRDTSPDFITKSRVEAPIEVNLQGLEHDPLDEFVPIEVFGGTYVIGDYYATEENGWAKILDKLI
ncbi:acetoacetate decarboxylase [Cytobacillus oceanisediminis]|uniref:Acetoacetate decarboxylase n=1 Tax=Cytobacillus oceanisediminis TaxID=665099 RepID=A0A2V3ACT0_9BACI|nr:acetoacetate decarboxylase family protein [Cytobacillus oceanisediminis]PWW31324.1 acetoacetate decarboxylase [Cytobacillus oceanisediminis]